MKMPNRDNFDIEDQGLSKALGAMTKFRDFDQESEFSKLACGALATQSLISNASRSISEQMSVVDALAEKLNNATSIAAGSNLDVTRNLEEFIGFSAGNAANALNEHFQYIDRRMSAVDSMASSVSAIEDQFSAASELCKFAESLSGQPPFSDASTKLLRDALGDWRGLTSFPDTLLDDAIARCDFYRDLGFNDALTDFAAIPDYLESVEKFALHVPVPDVIPGYFRGPHLYKNIRDSDELFLNVDAYQMIRTFETILRQFIVDCMLSAFGRLWMKHRIPQDTYADWKRRRKHDVDSGRKPGPLISYADFSDYQKIICRKDNWNEIFKVYFSRKESVQESFIRLGPVRNCVMHGRIITPDDHIIAFAETRQILRVIKPDDFILKN